MMASSGFNAHQMLRIWAKWPLRQWLSGFQQVRQRISSRIGFTAQTAINRRDFGLGWNLK